MARICIVTLNFLDDSLDETLAKARQAGFRYFETWQMDTKHHGDLRLNASEPDGVPEAAEVRACIERIQEAAERHGVQPAVIGGFNDFIQADDADLEREVAKVKAYIEVAVGTGCRVIRVMGGEPKANLAPDAWVGRVVEGFQACVGDAERAGVTLALENHGLITNHAPTALKILEQVGSERLRCNMDASNYRWAGYALETVYEFYRLIAPYTAYAHLKGGDGRTGAVGSYTATRLDQGELDPDLFVRTLAEAGFDGEWGIEYEGREEPLEAQRRNLEFATELLLKHGYEIE